MEKSYTIYAFCDPDTKAVRYIGATCVSPRARFSEIKSGYKRGSFQEVGAWIWALLDAGKEPLAVVLEANTPDGINGERRWIMAYRSAGAALFNKSAGGQGPTGIPHTEEWKADISRRQKDRVFSEETRAKISAAKIGKPRPDLVGRNKQKRRLSPEDLTEITAMLADGKTMQYVGDAFGVSASLICMIKSGKRYSFVV